MEAMEAMEEGAARAAGRSAEGTKGRMRVAPNGIQVVPSILAADFARLGDEVREAEDAGARWFQVDVMDGHFVPNISVGVPVLKSLRTVTDAFLDVHLMIEDPADFLEPFVEAGADLVTIHQEASVHLHRDVHEIRRLGARAGVAVNPATPVATLREILPFVDLVLVMTVNPGFGGQGFIHACLRKVTAVRDMAGERGLRSLHVQVDGGVDAETAPLAAEAGASSLVAGSSVFRGEGGVAESFRRVRESLAVQV